VAQADDDDTSTDNVRPFPGTTSGATSGTKRRRKRGSRAAARRAKYRSKINADRDATVQPAAPKSADIPADISRNISPVEIDTVTAPVRVTVTPPDRVTPPPAHTTTAPPHHGRGVRFAALVAALGLATVSAGFSITGMTAIFVGAFLPVIGMGIALEVGKLAAVAWLGHQRGTASMPLRAALGVLVVVLMGLNAVGCYGFLAKAHIGHAVEGETAVGARAADIEARISVQAAVVADLDRRIGQIDGAVEKSTAKGRTHAAMQLAADQHRNRAELAAQRDQANKTVADLKIEKAGIEGQRKVAEADLGPIRYLATLIGAGDQDVLRWFILVVALLLDPAAVLLLLAATRR
jgi:hypothetical protein